MPTIEKDESDGNGGTIVLSVVADVTDANCPGFDANTETTTEDCQDRLMTIVDDCKFSFLIIMQLPKENPRLISPPPL